MRWQIQKNNVFGEEAAFLEHKHSSKDTSADFGF